MKTSFLFGFLIKIIKIYTCYLMDVDEAHGEHTSTSHPNTWLFLHMDPHTLCYWQPVDNFYGCYNFFELCCANYESGMRLFELNDWDTHFLRFVRSWRSGFWSHYQLDMILFPSGFRKGFFCVFRVGVDGAWHVLLYDNSKIKQFLTSKFWYC